MKQKAVKEKDTTRRGKKKQIREDMREEEQSKGKKRK